MVPVAGWKETQVSDMDFDTIMEKAYEEYFEGLAEGEEAPANNRGGRRRVNRRQNEEAVEEKAQAEAEDAEA